MKYLAAATLADVEECDCPAGPWEIDRGHIARRRHGLLQGTADLVVPVTAAMALIDARSAASE